MKPIVTLAFLLLFTLGSSLGYAHSNDHNQSSYFFTGTHAEKTQDHERVTATLSYIANANGSNERVNELCCIEEDEQDETNKPVASRYFIAFYYAFFLNDRDGTFTNSLPFYNSFFYNTSCKYITLRVLRI